MILKITAQNNIEGTFYVLIKQFHNQISTFEMFFECSTIAFLKSSIKQGLRENGVSERLENVLETFSKHCDITHRCDVILRGFLIMMPDGFFLLAFQKSPALAGCGFILVCQLIHDVYTELSANTSNCVSPRVC